MTLNWIDAELEAIRGRGLYRSPRGLASRQGPIIQMDGREFVNFCSNDYLGLAADPRLIRAAQEAAEKYGAGAGSSRLIAGNLGIFTELEERAAAFLEAPAALLFNSGYHANLGLITTLVGREDAVFSDRLNHASIIDGCRLSRAQPKIYDHADPEHLEQLLAASTARRKLVVTESIFSMDGDLAPLPDLITVARRHHAMIMVDDAHGFGVLGPSGRGGLESAGLTATDGDALVITLGKSLGGAGALVLGARPLIDLLVNRARTFIFTTGPAPAAAGAALAGLHIIEQEPWRRERALALAARLRSALGQCSSAGPITPVVQGDEQRALTACQKLLAAGLFVQAIRPPTVPVNTARLRVSTTAAHTDDQLDRLIKALREVTEHDD